MAIILIVLVPLASVTVLKKDNFQFVKGCNRVIFIMKTTRFFLFVEAIVFELPLQFCEIQSQYA